MGRTAFRGKLRQVTVIVTRNGVGSQPEPVTIVPVAPAIFYLPDAGGWAIAINADGSLAAPENAIPGVATHPAGAGDGSQILRQVLARWTRQLQTGRPRSTNCVAQSWFLWS